MKVAKTVRKLAVLVLAAAMVFQVSGCNQGAGETGEREINVSEHTGVDQNKAWIKSIDGKLTYTISKNEDGNYTYTVSAEDKDIVGESVLELVIDGKEVYKDAEITGIDAKHIKTTYPYIGNWSEITDDCIGGTVNFKKGDYSFGIEVKVYNSGVAFRYSLPDIGEERLVDLEKTEFNIPSMITVWCGEGSDCYEPTIGTQNFKKLAGKRQINGPILMTVSSTKYVSIMEGYVEEGYIGTCFAAQEENSNTFEICGSWNKGKTFEKFDVKGDIKSGWRVINYGSLKDIVESTVIYSTALGLDGTGYTKDTSWIVPGKSVWSWINGRDVTYEKMLEYTKLAAKLGFTYNLIDASYTKWGKDFVSKLENVVKLGNENNVKQILWASVSGGDYGYPAKTPDQAGDLVDKMAELGMVGIKLDFFHPETELDTYAIERETLKAAMENHMLVDFHGVHKPTSLNVLYPCELSREGIRGLENINRKNMDAQSSFLVYEYYTRLLSGHADFTPDVIKGFQAGSLVVLDSPLMVTAAEPAELLESEIVEIVKAVPTAWDNTIFLDGTVGKFVSVAKIKDKVAYVGGVVGSNSCEPTVNTGDFLEDGEYLMTYYRDYGDAYKSVIREKIKSPTSIDIGRMESGQGYIMQFTKLELSQHGGKINGPIEVFKANEKSTVKYTTDGTNPMTSSTAIKLSADNKITLEESTLLTIAITDGDGKGTKMQYQFNKITD